MNPTICLLVGDNHTAHCGVKDYALRLASALGEVGLPTEVMAPPAWNSKEFLPFSRMLQQRKFDVVHLQYPSIGHRASLWPHWMGRMELGTVSVVTLHEFSALPRSQRISTHLFRLTANQLIFTSEREMHCYGRSRVPKRVVHIGSNVPSFPAPSSRNFNVLYFGQIRPDKGLEAFLELARDSELQSLPLNFQILGSVPERRSSYYAALREGASAQIQWTIDPPFEKVGRIMASSLAAYLPFPDGASYRRGSLLAALSNGLPVITRVGPATPYELVPEILPARTAAQALAHLQLLLGSPHEVQQLGSAARVFAERFSWPRIAREHLQIYEDALRSVRGASKSTIYCVPQ
jgi:glycosyltransferase involved in cell wall biosynthesis